MQKIRCANCGRRLSDFDLITYNSMSEPVHRACPGTVPGTVIAYDPNEGHIFGPDPTPEPEPVEHWLYVKAQSEWLRVQAEQIKKGIAKYPTPLGDSGLSVTEFANHAIQENVDQMHYLTALKTLAQKYEKALRNILIICDKSEAYTDGAKAYYEAYKTLNIKENPAD